MKKSNKKTVIVNTWITKNTSWITSEKLSADEVNYLIEAVMSLPVKVKTPIHFSQLSLPRYYLIVYNDNEITDILGVRIKEKGILPTSWGYKIGYWHPYCQVLIYRSLNKLLKVEQIPQPQ